MSPHDLPLEALRAQERDADRRTLTRWRLYAGLAMAGTLGATIGLYAVPEPRPFWLDLAHAAAKAGFVGAVADWFAVNALFRYPFGRWTGLGGLLPRQKQRLAGGMGRFVARQFFTPDSIRRAVEGVDVGAAAGRFLSDPAAARRTAIALAPFVPQLLEALADGRAVRALRRVLPRIVSGPEAGPVVARLLRSFLDGSHHQEVFSQALTRLKSSLTANEAKIKAAIEARVAEQGGSMVKWVAGAWIARKVLSAANAELAKVEPDDSDLRAAFDAWVNHEIERLEKDPVRAAEIGAALRRAVSHPAVALWLEDAVMRLSQMARFDAEREDGRIVTALSGLFGNLGRTLSENEASRAGLNKLLEETVAAIAPSAQTRIEGFVAAKVSTWSDEDLIERIELKVGRELQLIRLNGTLVGAAVGALLYGALTLLFGRVPV
ncbi:DUF445 domain-containing protein [Elioraea rosea]|uniref:DUF445 domain-containing protein n=1 Tax=Elioraea rosea TaxID=2492390 RepID=UPI0011840899|nr:DUF445 domain-containing protein [Elioraea rosea]